MKSSLLIIAGLLAFILINAAVFKKDSINSHADKKYKIALLVTATGKYINFVPELLASADKFFCTRHDVKYFIFTDGMPPQNERTVQVPHVQMGWPYDSMMRFHTYYNNRELFKDYDYIFAIDADMLFGEPIGDEILGERVGTRHPQFLFERGNYETNPLSTACIHRNEGKYYFCGGFYGGSRDGFMQIMRTTIDTIDTDLARGFVAVYNDESHLNRYFIDNPPTVVLSPAYCNFENWQSPYPKKVIALDKICAQTRKPSNLNPLGYYVKFLANKLAGG